MKKLLLSILLLTSLSISAMSNVKTHLSKLGSVVSNKWFNTKLSMAKYTQQELDQMLFDTASIDPDQKISRIKNLIKHGANVNYVQQTNNFTPLYTAIAAGYLGENKKTVQLLLKKGAHKNQTINIAGITYTPLSWAQLAQNSPKVIKLLINTKE